ncbi:hypothetical protein FA13DRAFT_1715930 [Coprinellus micaceus]|uniref:Uncharacterized protein n=1 Tax=Coprinellus micaceus TaxID=71717 RepID=A0A4Y7SMX8_COPMI|nr:hypothetical protein FA13DRAFT_1715930 [Coprinellus micaceus]
MPYKEVNQESLAKASYRKEGWTVGEPKVSDKRRIQGAWMQDKELVEGVRRSALYVSNECALKADQGRKGLNNTFQIMARNNVAATCQCPHRKTKTALHCGRESDRFAAFFRVPLKYGPPPIGPMLMHEITPTTLSEPTEDSENISLPRVPALILVTSENARDSCDGALAQAQTPNTVGSTAGRARSRRGRNRKGGNCRDKRGPEGSPPRRKRLTGVSLARFLVGQPRPPSDEFDYYYIEPLGTGRSLENEFGPSIRRLEREKEAKEHEKSAEDKRKQSASTTPPTVSGNGE